MIPVKRGILDDIVTVDSEDRTRVIFNLLGTATVTQTLSPGFMTVSFGARQSATAAAIGVRAAVESKPQKELASSQTTGMAAMKSRILTFGVGQMVAGELLCSLEKVWPASMCVRKK
ncbi:MAG: hypothetical protein CM1200mP41_12980 [Gammaproteobacteria bacterium]|nr:MAG: hypothetical protein CM1200mP41_12980 [Gammaproteobacteria bacterium]